MTARPIQSTLLATIPGVEHGFGTRQSEPWPMYEPTIRLRQVHSAQVVDETGDMAEADALITEKAGIWISVKTADCVPLLLATKDGQKVAAVHAGWRGAAAKIVANTLTKLGTADVMVAMGPSIGACCFEVGPEVAEAFQAEFPDLTFDGKRKVMLDLREALFRQLVTLGVAANDIERLPDCTKCDAQQFHSFRRDSVAAGRMISAIRKR
jgi:polyphenol oxidase